MKYIVKVEYKRFEFESATTAISWAEVAKNAAVDEGEETEVTITLIRETD